MNIMFKGVVLDVEGVEENARLLTRREAKKIIAAQWKEIKTGRKSIQKEETEPGIPGIELPLPSEKGEWAENIIADKVRAWGTRWEEKDIDRFMEFYSKKFSRGIYNFKSWKNFKAAFNSRHGNIRLKIENINIRIEKKIAIASFIQDFKSDRMETRGTKILYFIKVKGDYKIIKEVWQKEVPEKSMKRPYVVHIASFRSHDLALREVNILRRKGYSAYEVLFEVKGEGGYYRVVIDRFSTEAEAKEFSRSIMRKKIIDYGNPIKLPYSVKTGLYQDREEAYQQIVNLRKLGYSPYPLVDCVEKGCAYQVLVGAYESEENSLPMAERLTEDGVENSIVKP